MPIGAVTVVAQRTYVAKPGEIDRQWHVVDGTDAIVGRLASQIAVILMGKHRPTYTAHVDTGDYVIVTNADNRVQRHEVAEQDLRAILRLPRPESGDCGKPTQTHPGTNSSGGGSPHVAEK